MADPKPKKPKKTKPVVVADEVVSKPAPAAGGDEPGESGDSPPKIVLKDKHALRNKKAMTTVRCKVTINLRSAGGHMMQLRKGKNVPVPAEAVEDLRRSKSIH